MSKLSTIGLLVLLFAASNAMATTTITAPCDSTTHQSQWYTIGADDSMDFRIEAGSTASGSACEIQTTAWNRNHWTITCWVTSSSSSHTSYTCHNWNTVFGDAWKASFSYMACPQSGCATSEKEQKMIKNIRDNLNTKDARLMINHNNK